jgi:hypothetical protein
VNGGTSAIRQRGLDSFQADSLRARLRTNKENTFQKNENGYTSGTLGDRVKSVQNLG